MEPQKVRVSPRKAPKQRRSQQTVDAILEATARVLVQEGYSKASTNRIAKVAGVSIGSLYQYFPSKEALVMALAEQHCNAMLELLSQTAADLADAPIAVAVRSYVKAMLRAHSVEPELHRVLVSQMLHIGLEHMHAIEEASRRIVRMYLELRRNEILPKDLDAAAFVLVTTVEAITHRAVLESPERLSAPALEEELCAIVLRYLTGTDGAP